MAKTSTTNEIFPKLMAAATAVASKLEGKVQPDAHPFTDEQVILITGLLFAPTMRMDDDGGVITDKMADEIITELTDNINKHGAGMALSKLAQRMGMVSLCMGIENMYDHGMFPQINKAVTKH